MKPSHRQDSQQHKDVLAARSRMETWPTRHPRATVSPACALTRARTMPSDKMKASLSLLAAPCVRRGVEAPLQGRAAILSIGGEQSFMTYRRQTASVVDGAHSCNLPQQAPACSSAPRLSRRGLAGPIRRSRFGCIKGRQASRGGDSPQGFPLEASTARSSAGAKA